MCVLYSCGMQRRPISVNAPQNNRTYRIEYLFEHDGCKVYRFMDDGHYVYFTNCRGTADSIESDSIRIVNQTVVR
ncbi:MAG: DUF4884 domain-containing protein [Prevotellaceae bacterium]|nr:DUF4884 domain-containing protein [Prevotellaceae bacterium]